MTATPMKPKVGRNDACPCGSGNKYKRCCMDKGQASPAAVRACVEATSDLRLEASARTTCSASEPEAAIMSRSEESRSRTALAEAESSLLVHLELYSWLGNEAAMALAYSNLGCLYQELGDLEAADAMHDEASKLRASL